MRYMLPAYPALAALAGVGAARLMRERGWIRWVAPTLLAACVLWALAFTNGVHLREHPRLAAADWMVEHAADGSVLSVDEWDDGLPFTPADDASKGFTSVMFTPFDTESPDDVRRLVEELDQVDYVVQSSDRITGVIGRVPARYAPVLRYQQALEDGSLGFESVATFSTRPSLLGIEVDDTGSEEAFRVYDHPTVRIWRKTDAFSLAQRSGGSPARPSGSRRYTCLWMRLRRTDCCCVRERPRTSACRRGRRSMRSSGTGCHWRPCGGWPGGSSPRSPPSVGPAGCSGRYPTVVSG